MKVTLNLDPKWVWRTEEAAEKAGMSLEQYMVHAVESWPVLPKKGAATRSRVAELHKQGLTDREISERIERVPRWVRKIRIDLGLKPNKERKTV